MRRIQYPILILSVSLVAVCESSTECCGGEGFWGPVIQGVVRISGEPAAEVVINGEARSDNNCETGGPFDFRSDTTDADGRFRLELMMFGGGPVGDTIGELCVRLEAVPPQSLGVDPDTVFLLGIPEIRHGVTEHTVDFEFTYSNSELSGGIRDG